MKKILLATDGSQPARDAARFLARLPHDEKIELIVVSVLVVPGVGVRGSSLAGMGDWIDKWMAQERTSAEQAFADIEAVFEGANVSLTHVVREGFSSEAIVAIARETQPELLVIGATGHSAIARMLLGSTSDYVATHAPCSVLVVRPAKAMNQDHRLRIAIGYEESEPAQAAIEEFAEFGWAGETDVRVVSVTYQPRFYDAPNVGSSPEGVKKAAEQLHAFAPQATGSVVQSDHIGEGLVKFIEEEEIDVMVVGETPRTRLGRVLMGSMTRYVLRHAPCSVWITRNRMIAGASKNVA